MEIQKEFNKVISVMVDYLNIETDINQKRKYLKAINHYVNCNLKDLDLKEIL